MLLGWDGASATSLQLEITWLADLSKTWPVAEINSEKAKSLVNLFGLFPSAASPPAVEDAQEVEAMVRAAAIDYGFSL